MRVGLISTINTNIGDDFIREGLVRAVQAAFGGSQLQFSIVNKHDPSTYYPAAELVKYLRLGGKRSASVIGKIARRVHRTRLDRCELVVQCGAPVYWDTCGETTAWRDELWYGIVDRISRSSPVLNLAAGSCYPCERIPQTIERPGDQAFIRRIHGMCQRTTVRDRVAERLLQSLELSVERIHCSACLAADPTESVEAGRFIIVNYMRGGGHYDWSQGIDAEKWESVAVESVRALGREFAIRIVCHDAKEVAEAERLFPSFEVRFPKTIKEYRAAVVGAAAGLCNRMHASVFMAGLGIPSVTVGTDTRLAMVEEFGIPSLYVKECSAERLVDAVHELVAAGALERRRLLDIRSTTFHRYQDVVKSIGIDAG